MFVCEETRLGPQSHAQCSAPVGSSPDFRPRPHPPCLCLYLPRPSPSAPAQSQPQNTSSVGLLLVQFFRFYALEFRMESYVVCIKLGRLGQTKASVWSHRAVKVKPNRLSIEDPFNINHDLGR